MMKTLDSNYAKSDLKQVFDNGTQMNYEERILLLSLLKDFEDLFCGTLGDWATETIDLDLKPYFKPFNSRYYPVPLFNREIFRKEL